MPEGCLQLVLAKVNEVGGIDRGKRDHEGLKEVGGGVETSREPRQKLETVDSTPAKAAESFLRQADSRGLTG